MRLPLAQIIPHPLNSNVMPAASLDKLHAHIQQTGLYPPLIVRPWGDGRYQLLDGHHRRIVLEKLGHTHAACEVWPCDDARASLLLATLNRLQGRDDPHKRAHLLQNLRNAGLTASQLARLLPDRAAQLRRLAQLRRPLRLAPPTQPHEIPRAVCFFLLEPQRRALDAALHRLGGPREQALMQLVEAARDGEGPDFSRSSTHERT